MSVGEVWIIEVYRTRLDCKAGWYCVRESICDKWRARTGNMDTETPFTPRSLEACVEALKNWYEEIKSEKFVPSGEQSPQDWVYRLYNTMSGESIPGDLFK